MKFKDLLSKLHWNEIFWWLNKNYPETKNQKEQYFSVWNILQNLSPAKTNTKIIIKTYIPDPNEIEDDDGDQQYFDVFGTNGDLNKDMSDFHMYKNASNEFANAEVHYGLDFVPWNEWLEMEINQETYNFFSPASIVSHCLYEMTVWSFDQDKIKEIIKEMQASMKGIHDSISRKVTNSI